MVKKINGQPDLAKQVAALTEQNAILSDEVRTLRKKIERYFLMSNIWTIVKIIFIVGPIIVAFIYLPPLFKDLIAEYQQVLPNTQKILR
jgi:hypothetical protein